MNSSTSSSEGTPETGVYWAGFARALLLTAAVLTSLPLVALVLLDPYDTGRTPLALEPGLRPQGPRTASASRGRDPAFDAVILGNSHVQLIEPAALSAGTGLAFLTLATPGTGPKEGLALLDWFLRHRDKPARAVVVGIDEHWCTPDQRLPPGRPFPFWLLSPGLAEYIVGLLRFDALEELPLRIASLVQGKSARARRDGFWDYTGDFDGQGRDAARLRRAQLDVAQKRGGGNASGPFPAAAALEALLARNPAETALILLRPPAYQSALPIPGSADAAADAACKAAFMALAAKRPRTEMIDWRVDRPETRDPDRFFDHTHYRRELAQRVEADIAAALARLR